MHNFFPQRLALSPTEQKIYDFIYQYPEKVQYITIEKLAANLHTSVASIQRFCKKIGFSGFKEFKFKLKDYLVEHQDEHSSSNSTYLDKYVSAVKQFKNIDSKTIKEFKSILLSSPKIFSFGMFYSGLPAKLLTYTLLDQDKIAFYSDNLISISHLSPLFDKKDTLVVFSITGEENDIDNFITQMAKKSDNTFLITFNSDAPIKKYFKHQISLPDKSFAYRAPIDPQSLFCLFVEMVMGQE